MAKEDEDADTLGMQRETNRRMIVPACGTPTETESEEADIADEGRFLL